MKFLDKQLFLNQSQDNDYMEINIKDILYIVTKRFWVVLIFMLIAAVAARQYAIYSYSPTYTTTTSLLVNYSSEVNATTSAESYADDIDLSRDFVDSYAAIIDSNRVMELAVQKLGMDISASDLNGYVSVSTDKNAGLLYLKVTNSDPQTALDISNAVIEVAPQILTEYISLGSIKVLDPAEFPEVAARPSTTKNIIIGALLGFVVGVALLVLLMLMKPTIMRTHDIKSRIGLKVLGSIPHIKKSRWRGKKKVPQITKPKITSNFYEAIKSLRTNVLYLSEKKDIHAILISGAAENEGKTTTAVNLALSLSSQYKVLIIDADLHKPSIARELRTSVKNNVSLKFLLDYPERYQNYVKVSPQTELSVLTFKKINEEEDIFKVAQLKELLRIIKEDYDYIIIDSPPSQYADATIIAQAVDAVVLAVRQNHTPVDVIIQSQTDFVMVQAEILGAILTDAHYIRFDSVSKYKYYHSRYRK